jgi:integrase
MNTLSVATMGRIFWLRTDKVNTKGFCPVSLRLTLRGHKPTELSTGVRCRPADWAGATGKNGPIKKSHPEYSADSEVIETLRLNVKTAVRRLEAMGERVTPATVANLLKNPDALTPQPDPCLLAFMENELETSYKAGNRATYEAMRAIVRKLRAWHGASPLPLKDLPPTRAMAFYRHLLSATARGGEIRTANKAIINLTAMYRRGVKQLKWPAADNPFLCIDKKRDLKREKVRLTAVEYHVVASLPLDPTSWLWRARTAFLMQFYLRGERIGACLQLRWANIKQKGTVVRYQAQKGGPFKQVPVEPELAELLAQLAHRQAEGQIFVLPFLPNSYDKIGASATIDATRQLTEIKAATSGINKALKEVAQRAGIDKPLRSHAARHTFGTLARKSQGVAFVQQAFGHATERMTQTYLAGFDNDELDANASSFFSSLRAAPVAPPVQMTVQKGGLGA